VIAQDIAWQHGVEREAAGQPAGGEPLTCTITRQNAADRVSSAVSGSLMWLKVNELSLSSNGWQVVFRYLRAQQCIRLVSAEYDVHIGETAMKELTKMHSSTQADAASPSTALHSGTLVASAVTVQHQPDALATAIQHNQ